MDPAPVASPQPSRPPRWVRLLERIRPEDWLLVAWIAIVSPLLGHGQGSQPGPGPFDGGQPLEGIFRLVAVLGALACIVTRNADGPANAPGVLERASVGPLTGGLLLVGISGASGLGLTGNAGYAPLIVAVVVTVVVRIRWPALPTTVRRALVTPLVLAAGGIFWTIVDSVSNGGSWFGLVSGASAGQDLGSIAFVVSALVAFAAVFYAMLVYAPRQVAEAEGGVGEWLARFGLFLASLGLGVAWLRPFGM